MDEKTLATMLVTNLDGSFEEVVVLYGERLFRFALRLTNNREDAQEIAQDTFVRAYHALREYEPERIRALLLRPWLYRIALNVSRNRRRRRTLEIVRLDGDGPLDREEERPERVAERVERQVEMAALLAAVPERYRGPIVLRHVEGLTYREIAEILSQPMGTVKSNVHRGLEMLRVMIVEGEVMV